MIDFIVKNYQFIALVVAALVDVVLLVVAVCRKKGDQTFSAVCSRIPDYIIAAEDKFGCGHGSEKKKYVLDLACKVYEKFTGVKIYEGSHIYGAFAETIENVLQTPQKKER